MNHFEGAGLKVEKYGAPDRSQLAKEIQDVLRTALSVARHYGVEEDLHRSIARIYDDHRRDGLFDASDE